jgi:hypothetical protein
MHAQPKGCGLCLLRGGAHVSSAQRSDVDVCADAAREIGVF